MFRKLAFGLLAFMLLTVPAFADPPTRNYNGFSTVTSDDPLGWLTMPDPTKWAVFLDDFMVYDLAQGTTHYTFTSTTGTVDTNTGLSGYPGILVLTFDAGDNDVGQIQVTSGNIIIAAAKKAMFECRVKVDKGAGGTIGQQELLFGLSTVATTTDLTAADGLTLTANDVIGFWSPDGTANLGAVIRATDVENIDADATTYADATWMVLSWYYDGAGTTKFYKNDVLISTSTATLPTTVTSPILFAKAGEGAACVLSVDYIMLCVER